MEKYLYFITTIFFITFCSYLIIDEQETIIKQNKSIIEKLDARTRLDSIYAEHIGTCSFVSREDLAFDKRGYVYDVRKTANGWLVDYKPNR